MRFRSLLLYAGSMALALVASSSPSMAEEVDFARDILPLFQKNCVACHNSKLAEGGLKLDTFALMMRGGDAGPMIVPHAPEKSSILGRLTGEEDDLMPPEGNSVGAVPLTEMEIARVRKWIEEGAKGNDSSGMPAIVWSTVPEQLRPTYALDVTADGQWLAKANANRVTVLRWPDRWGAQDSFLLVDPGVQQTTGGNQPASHLDMVQAIAFSADGERIATGGFREIKIWARDRRVIPTDAFGIPLQADPIVASHDGKWVAIGVTGGRIEIWNEEGSQRRTECQGFTSPIVGIAWSPSGERVLAFDQRGDLRVWKLPNESNAILKAQDAIGQATLGQAVQAEWIGEERWAVRTTDKKLSVGRMVPKTEASPNGIEWLPWPGSVADAESIAVIQESPSRLVVGHSDGQITLHEPDDGKPLATWNHGASVPWLFAVQEPTRVISLGSNGITRLWNAADGQVLAESQGDARSRQQLAAVKSNVVRQQGLIARLTAVAAELEKNKQAEIELRAKQKAERDKVAEMVATKEAEQQTAMQAMVQSEAVVAAAQQAVAEAMKKAEEATKAMAAAQEAKKKADASRAEAESTLAKHDQTLAAADEAVERATKAIPTHQASMDSEQGTLTTIQSLLERVQAEATTISLPLAATLTRDGRHLLTSHSDQTLRIQQVQQGTPAEVVATHARWTSLATTSQQGLWASRSNGPLQWRSLGNRWRLERTIGGSAASPITDRVTALDFSPDGKLLAVGSGPPSRFGEVKIFAAADGELMQEWSQLHSDTVQSVQFSPSGLELASAGADKIIRITRLSERQPYRTLEGHTHHVLGLAWHEQGHWLASASADNTIKVWDVPNGQQWKTLTGSSKEVTALAFVGGSNQLASSSADRIVRLHDAEKGNVLKTFSGAQDALYALGISDEGKSVVAAGQDGKLWIWQLEDAKVRQQLE